MAAIEHTCDCPYTGHTVECVRAWVAESRAAQGLPPTLTDPATLARIARMIRDTPIRSPDQSGPGA